MDLSRIDLNLLVVLEAIYTEGGLTRAGERLNVTQPAVSHALGRLRNLLGDPLFVREGHGMVPTPFTRNLIGPLRQALRAMELTLNEAKRFDPGVSAQRFTLGCRDALELRVLPRLMYGLSESAPELEIATVSFRRRDIEADLFSGQLDLVTDSLLPRSRNIRHVHINTDPLVVMARKDHPALADGLDLEAYLEQRHILVSSRRTGQGMEDFELARGGLQRKVSLRCQHFFAASRVVRETDLLLTIPGRLAGLLNIDDAYALVPFPLDMPPQDVYLCWHANVDNDPANYWLRQQIIAVLEAV
ncbi:LysR family transcriptional regulator [Alkalilimnicola ehrlichii]|uniref:LysR family transcriptional regulator n=1 Tax=Alkalilimnicola ehrlichii TaxID=351052 RepID=A0A3E0WVV8_9GAMM|nr:LysR family transcriptional regulator [Alkalilimnicola ehrlichii]RFA29223.1 LysR family transcriptional regulator [Alkalilimnicola ehrlichii]RFA36135.1 LysR family transcriptional regulator [Alkalilimnicola ehrlichii]